MKSKAFLRRCIAIMLCMAVVLSVGGGYLLADSFQEQPAAEESEVQTEEGTENAEEQPEADETVQIDVSDAAEEEPKEEGEAETPAEETPGTEDTGNEVQEEEQVTETPKEETEQTEEAEEEVWNQAMTLTTSVKGVNDETCSVKATIPEKAFQAEASQIELKVTAVTKEEKDTISKLMEAQVTEGHELSGYVMYRVAFLVNGKETEPEKSVDVEMRGTNLPVSDPAAANSFYFAPAGSEEGVQKDCLAELPQREETLKKLLASTGKTREELEAEYDFSEVTVKEENLEVLKLEAQRNRIYGCYIIEEKEIEAEEPNAIAEEYTGKSGATGSDKTIMVHEKYIKKNADGTYNITLNASGSIGSQTNKAKVDILLIVDTSGSMSGTSLTNTKSAINALVDAFNEKSETVESRYKLVTFATAATTETGSWVSGSTLKNSYVRNLTANGGTNYDKGLSYGAEAISTADPDARKIVIFLTDGKPTYYGEKKGFGDETSKNTLDAAITSAKKVSCDDFYAVGIGLPSSIKIYTNDNKKDKVSETVSGLEILNRVKNAVSAGTKDAWNLKSSSELTAKFKDIAGQTLNFACSKVVISDTLSKYVDVTENSRIKVNIAKKNADGSFTDVSGNGRSFTLSEVSGGKSGTVYEEQTAIGTVTYLADTKTAKLTFNSDYTLKEGYYYYLTITKVIPTSEAFQYYAAKGYPSVGSDYTDEGNGGYAAATGGTSSKKEGFYSNASATISYEWKGTAYEEGYPDPVVQVEKVTVQKEWKGINDPAASVPVQLLDKEGNAVEGQILRLSAENDYTGQMIVEQAANYSGVRELMEVPEGTKGAIAFENKYYAMIEPDGIMYLDDEKYQVTYTSEQTDDKMVYRVTNTKRSEKIRVLKKQSGSGTSAVYLEGAEFTLKDSAGEVVMIGTNTTGTYRSTAEGVVLEGTIDYGKYTLVEVKAPAGYTLLEKPITITVDENGIAADLKNGDKVSCAKAEDGVYVISVTNEMLYELPSAGGRGIFWYTIGGVMLMMTAALILYKKKYEELLGE